MWSRIGPWFDIVLGCGFLFFVLSGWAWNKPQPLAVNVAVGAFGVSLFLRGVALLVQRSRWVRASKPLMVLAGAIGLGSIGAWAGSFSMGIMMIALIMLPVLALFLVPKILSRGSASSDAAS